MGGGICYEVKIIDKEQQVKKFGAKFAEGIPRPGCSIIFDLERSLVRKAMLALVY